MNTMRKRLERWQAFKLSMLGEESNHCCDGCNYTCDDRYSSDAGKKFLCKITAIRKEYMATLGRGDRKLRDICEAVFFELIKCVAYIVIYARSVVELVNGYGVVLAKHFERIVKNIEVNIRRSVNKPFDK